MGNKILNGHTDENNTSLPSSITGSSLAKEDTSSNPAIEGLDLEATAKAAAYELKKKHPTIEFTSGRRGVTDQARAMAQNIVESSNRKWITATYIATDPIKKLQKWVDDNPTKTAVADISTGLETIMNSMTDAERAQVSKHLTGEAFDVKPVTKDAAVIKKDMQSLKGAKKFLEREGGLVRWHVQF